MNRKIIITLVIGLIIGLSLSGIGTYAATTYAISANKIAYSDNSSLGVDNVQAAIDGTCTKFDNQLLELKKSMYPVGSIYFSATLSTPEKVKDLLGGEWEVYGKGKTLVGVDSDDSDFETIGKTGGSKTNSTTLTINNLPSHTHDISHTHTTLESMTTTMNLIAEKAGAHAHELPLMGIGSTKLSRQYNVYWADDEIGEINSKLYTNYSGEHTHKVTGSISIPSLQTVTQSSTKSGPTGTGNSFSTSTIQPYITVYIYKRIK